MAPNPLLGVAYHWVGGLAAASFYNPYRAVRAWSWEIYWLTGAVFAFLLAPCIIADLRTAQFMAVLLHAPTSLILWCLFFGVLWGTGGITYGLTMRYLGLSLGSAVVLGLCTLFGTLIPPIVNGTFVSKLLASKPGLIILAGLAITLAGIVLVAAGGASKDRALSHDQKRATVPEFNYRKGLLVASFSGIMSSCFAFGLAAGADLRGISQAAGTPPLWSGLPVLCLVMFGGLITTSIWCVRLIVNSHSTYQWVGKLNRLLPSRGSRPMASPNQPMPQTPSPPSRIPVTVLSLNYLLCAIAGTVWYLQFFFYSMGESQMGKYAFSSWTLHMASIMIFGTMWGFIFGEWRDTSRRVRLTVCAGIALLVIATVVIGYGNKLDTL